MRSPWVGSLALLAPAHGFVAPSAAVRNSPSMLQAFVRPSAAGVSALSSRGRRQHSLRLQQLQRVAAAPRQSAAVGGVRMMAGGGGGGEGGGKQAKKAKPKKPESYYKQTVILPQTGFEQRANALKREPELQAFWDEERVYERMLEDNTGEKYVLHDGPPYANGDLHMGHALNKILKDFINRYQMLKGRKVSYVPGWDCHGLPIELKVLQSIKSKERAGMTPVQLRKKAAEFARSTVAKQSESFRRYGVMGDFEKPYLTLQPEYEAAQIEVFGKMFTEGHIFRGRKPVNWSPSSRTALAEAELEYPPGHTSTSVYAAFEVKEATPALEAYMGSTGGLAVSVWTTTPWTLPANLAVAVSETIDYSVVEHASLGDRKLLVATDLVAAVSAKMGLEEGDLLKVVETFKGKDLIGIKYQHPLCDRVSEVVVGGDYITTETGTGLVHTAPGHGQEDYVTGLKYGLPLLSPVDDAGKFTVEAGERFKGLNVLKEGNEEVLVALEEAGGLLAREAYQHKYPYDWRTKKPTIFRATDQWFASVDRFRDTALSAIDEVKWIPEVGQRRITTMVEGRNDWCISRQRSWGLPIPVFYNIETGEPMLTEESIEHVRGIVAEHGSDAWWEMETADLLPPSLRSEADQWRRGTDTMDVWFDSGSSWAGVAKAREDLDYPADLYLEGSDQHRGWFQSSLLTSVAANGHAPYKTVLTHGFVLDEKGYKMSKSLGNTVDPIEVIEGGNNKKQKPAYGADVLRLWVSSVDYSGDVCVGDHIIKQVSESYRKLRNTLRYLSGSLFDFDPSKHSVPYEDLPSLDKYMLGMLSSVLDEVETAFDGYQFYKASQALQRFATADLSNFYLDGAKDRLYISSSDDFRRRSCQTVLHTMLMSLASVMAPILPHMAEDVWQTLPFKPEGGHRSIFQAGWASGRHAQHESEKWGRLRTLRNDVNKALEQARAAKVLGSSLEGQVFIHCSDEGLKTELEELLGDETLKREPELSNGVDDLRFVLLVSKINLVDSVEAVDSACAEGMTVAAKDSESGCVVGVSRAPGDKCERCWYQCDSVGSHPDHPTLCSRCHGVVEDLGLAPPPPAAVAEPEAVSAV
eukprot:g11184.t1